MRKLPDDKQDVKGKGKDQGDKENNSVLNQKWKEIKNDERMIKLDKIKRGNLKQEISELMEVDEEREEENIGNKIIEKKKEFNELNRGITQREDLVRLNTSRAKVMELQMTRKSVYAHLADVGDSIQLQNDDDKWHE